MSTDVVVVGAGLAGLACAGDLIRAGQTVSVLEAGDGPGGRVRTDVVDGFRLDRGFQILLTAYPEVARRLDLGALDLCEFEPGAVVRIADREHRVADPIRRPGLVATTVRAPIGTFADKLRLLRLVADVRRRAVPDLLRRPETTTAERLARAGFSRRMIDDFWRPLFAGIQLDPDLEVSSRRFDTILRMLATGSSAVPRRGMGEIPAQLAAGLPPDAIRYGTRVAAIDGTTAVLDDGERVAGQSLVVATEGPAAHALLGERIPDPGSRAAACCWFATPSAPRPGPVLLLDGDPSGPVRNVAVMSEVSSAYAPPGRALVAAAIPGPEALRPGVADAAREQLARWFGSTTADWELLRTDVIPHGQPRQAPPFRPKQSVTVGVGVFVCGDHRDTASLQGALYSGGRAALAVLRALRGVRR
ncbi:MAG: NAD(P)/FAD-dependent oxidoreductase [Actinomycetota bacterium]